MKKVKKDNQSIISFIFGGNVIKHIENGDFQERQ